MAGDLVALSDECDALVDAIDDAVGELSGRDAPPMPRHTCPYIDRVVGMLHEVDRIKPDRYDDASTLYDQVQRELDLAPRELEALRKENAALRERAEWWEALADQVAAGLLAAKASARSARDAPAPATKGPTRV